MYIWNELSLPTGKRNGYDTMVGADMGPNSSETTLYVPLEFWFCRNVGLALNNRAEKHSPPYMLCGYGDKMSYGFTNMNIAPKVLVGVG